MPVRVRERSVHERAGALGGAEAQRQPGRGSTPVSGVVGKRRVRDLGAGPQRVGERVRDGCGVAGVPRQAPGEHGAVGRGEGVHRSVGDVRPEVLAQPVQRGEIASPRVERARGDAVEPELRVLGQALDRQHAHRAV